MDNSQSSNVKLSEKEQFNLNLNIQHQQFKVKS
jgi:hypothetical protein